MAAKKKVKKQAARFNTGKPKLSYILDFPHALETFVRICEMGAEKYDKHNWKQGLPYTDVEDSLLRHLEKFHNCQDADDESKQLHLGHVMWNAMALIEFHSDAEKSELFDNRDWSNK